MLCQLKKNDNNKNKKKCLERNVGKSADRNLSQHVDLKHKTYLIFHNDLIITLHKNNEWGDLWFEASTCE